MSRTDQAQRRMGAPPDAIYRAFVDPKAWTQWLPPAGMSGRIEHFDCRPGGTYRMTLTYQGQDTGHGKTSDNTDIVEGRFLTVIDGERIVQAVEFASEDPRFAGTMRMTWQVVPDGAGSIVTFTAEDVPSGISKADHDEGLASSLANLAAYVERTV